MRDLISARIKSKQRACKILFAGSVEKPCWVRGELTQAVNMSLLKPLEMELRHAKQAHLFLEALYTCLGIIVNLFLLNKQLKGTHTENLERS